MHSVVSLPLKCVSHCKGMRLWGGRQTFKLSESFVSFRIKVRVYLVKKK